MRADPVPVDYRLGTVSVVNAVELIEDRDEQAAATSRRSGSSSGACCGRPRSTDTPYAIHRSIG
jgi:hypothetical protein